MNINEVSLKFFKTEYHVEKLHKINYTMSRWFILILERKHSQSRLPKNKLSRLNKISMTRVLIVL